VQSKIGVGYGLAAALLFAVSTPLAKTLLASTAPVMLAALFYCGSGLGLFALALWRGVTRPAKVSDYSIKKSEIGWLCPAILFGGILAPIAMMQGLSLTGAAPGSMLLNLEGVFTAAIAWLAFKENVDRRIFVGMVCILMGGCFLSFNSLGNAGGLGEAGGIGNVNLPFSSGSLLIVLACIFWALDNNLCKKVSTSDSVLVAMVKGLVAGGVNLAIAFGCHIPIPPVVLCVEAMVIGFLSYGLSLVSYLTAQRYLGTARTGAYFASAPFVGAILALIFLHEPISTNLTVASALMLIGLWLHVTETHSHEHVHEDIEHSHEHAHDLSDLHHQHDHEPGVATTKPHTHAHKHERLLHGHLHYPDSHHHHQH
jgi:drug/metabolite transporter (DMT)-like permease